MAASNDQFLVSTLAIDSQPVNANECNSIQKLDYPAIPNSIPAKYLIVFQMNNGLYYKWTYLNSSDRDNEFATIQTAVTTTIVAFDPDALNFITTTGITGVEANAINQLVLDLKGYSLWSSFLAIYPFVGGTAFTQRYNLINVSNYTLTFNGSWTHSSTGALPDGATAYAETGIIPSVDLDPVKNHISFYSRTDADGLYADIGAYTSVPNSRVELMTKLGGNFEYAINTGPTNNIATANSLGMYTASRSASNAIAAYKNGAPISASALAVTVPASIEQIYIGARNLDGVANAFSVRESAFASVGNVQLAAGQVADLYTSVQAFQIALSRSV